MMKETKDKVQILKLNEKDIKKLVGTINHMEDDYEKILREEIAEKELRKAEIEAKKAENLIKYQEDIFNRPKK
jgi:ATP-dependent RNA helicase DDX27